MNMSNEARWLYIGIIISVILLCICFYLAGLSDGKLMKMEEFKSIYMPAEPELIHIPGGR